MQCKEINWLAQGHKMLKTKSTWKKYTCTSIISSSPQTTKLKATIIKNKQSLNLLGGRKEIKCPKVVFWEGMFS